VDECVPLGCGTEVDGRCGAVIALAPALRAPMLIALHATLYGAAVQAWGVTRVNSGFIFEAR